jgi:hypothetical protein
LEATAPDLFDALHQVVEPMQTFAEKRGQLASLLSGANYTVGTVRQSLGNHIDQLIRITSDFTPVLGVLAQNSHNFLPAVIKLDNLADKFMENVATPEGLGNLRAMLSFTPSYGYTRADCPHYGELKGPSCFTAPLVPVRPDLPQVLLPQNYQPPKDLAPPPGTVIGPDGNLVAVGPPLINPNPNLADPNPPLPAWLTPSPPVPGSANPDNASPPPGTVAPSSFGGNVGPVGSQYEQNMLTVITGQPATAATELLLGPIARGTTVSLKHSPWVGGPK